jgi:hypothetical protein
LTALAFARFCFLIYPSNLVSFKSIQINWIRCGKIIFITDHELWIVNQN